MNGWSWQSGRGLFTVAAVAGFAAWLVGTVASQHPHREFDRVRRVDPFGVAVPNWLFFAPEPAQHDYHVLHRVLTAEDEQTDWQATTQIAPRNWGQVLWFPGHRREKAVFDVCTELMVVMASPTYEVTETLPYQMLRDFVAASVAREYASLPRPQGFQFVVARHTGHDEEREPEYLLVSPFVPCYDVNTKEPRR